MEYVVPGVGFVAEDTGLRELLIPGGLVLAEESEPSAVNLFTPWIEG